MLHVIFNAFKYLTELSDLDVVLAECCVYSIFSDLTIVVVTFLKAWHMKCGVLQVCVCEKC